MKIDSIQAAVLATKKVNVTKGEWGVRGPGAEVRAAPRLRLISLSPELYLSGLSDSTMSFYFGHCNQGQVAYITHFQKEAVEAKD